jgi:hypothetical protein
MRYLDVIFRKSINAIRIKYPDLFNLIYPFAYPLLEGLEVLNYKITSRPVLAPRALKVKVIRDYAKIFSTGIFIETGTYFGDMVFRIKGYFNRIFSIELDEALYDIARKRFLGSDNISIIHGDSAETLSKTISGISQPCLFWLDAHFYPAAPGKSSNGGSPILKELDLILSHSIKGHVILIDDACIFNGQGGRPGIEELRGLIEEKCPDRAFEVKDDIIRIYRRVVV